MLGPSTSKQAKTKSKPSCVHSRCRHKRIVPVAGWLIQTFMTVLAFGRAAAHMPVISALSCRVCSPGANFLVQIPPESCSRFALHEDNDGMLTQTRPQHRYSTGNFPLCVPVALPQSFIKPTTQSNHGFNGYKGLTSRRWLTITAHSVLHQASVQYERSHSPRSLFTSPHGRQGVLLWKSDGRRSRFLLLLSGVCSCGYHARSSGSRLPLSKSCAEGVCPLRCSRASHIQAQVRRKTSAIFDYEECLGHH